MALFVLCAVILLAAVGAAAKSQIDVFRGSSRDLGKVNTILVMPVIFDTAVPDTEHFFCETLEQTWNEAIGKDEAGLRFIFKTPEQILEFEKLFSAVSRAAAQEDDEALVLSLAPLYVDAVMTLTITEASRGIIAHEAQYRWSPTVSVGGGYRHGGWRNHGGVILHREGTPAYDESYSSAALKIEIRDARDGENTLICGISARDMVKSGILPGTLSLTKLTDNLVKAAVSELAKLKP